MVSNRYAWGLVLLLVSTACAEKVRPAPTLKAPPSFQILFNNAYETLAEDNEAIGLADPNSPRRAFVALAAAATQSISACFFDIDDTEAVDALVAARRRKVRVRVVTDTDNLTDKQVAGRPRYAIERLKRAGITVRDDLRSPFMHHKFMVVDGRTVWFGSLNPTRTSFLHHNNNVVIVQSPRLASLFNYEFNDLFDEGRFGGPRNLDRPNFVRVGSVGMGVYFSPRGGARDALLREVSRAANSIRFMAFSFSDSELGQTMIERQSAGISVEGVFDDCQAVGPSMFDVLREAGVPVFRDGNQALMHHKVIIIDDETVIAGSYNYSMNADRSNNEALVIMRSKSIAAVFNEEYARIKEAAVTHRDIPPYDHPACRRRPAPSLVDKLLGAPDAAPF